MSANVKVTKNVWTPEHADKLATLEDLHESTRHAIAFLRVAERVGASPEHLQVLMRREYKRKCQQMVRVHTWARKLHGELAYGKEHEDGERYSWYAEFQLGEGYYLAFDFGRYHGADAFDIPIDFDVVLMRKRNKKKAERVELLVEQTQLESILSVKRAYTDALAIVKRDYLK